MLGAPNVGNLCVDVPEVAPLDRAPCDTCCFHCSITAGSMLPQVAGSATRC